MVLFRYAYLTVEFGSIVHNVFDRGFFNNFIDFFEIDWFGFQPLNIDWRYKFGELFENLESFNLI